MLLQEGVSLGELKVGINNLKIRGPNVIVSGNKDAKEKLENIFLTTSRTSPSRCSRRGGLASY